MKKEEREQKRYFKAFKEFTREENERKKNKELYDKIYGYYEIKTLDKDFDISLERIILNKNIGTHKSFRTNADLNMFIVILSLFLNSILQAVTVRISPEKATIVSCFVMFGLFVFFAIDFYRSKWRYKELVYFMCLKVLDEIEATKI